MAFLREEIFEEFEEASGRGREWFDGDGYGFRRLGKADNSDIDRLANLLRYKRWAAANRGRQRAISRAYYWRDREKTRRLGRAKRVRQKRNSVSRAKRLASWRAFRERRKADSEKYAAYLVKNREANKRKYEARKADPVKLERMRAQGRERMRRRYALKRLKSAARATLPP